MLLRDQQVASRGDIFRAVCTASESVFDFVRITGSGEVTTCDIDASTLHEAIGVIVSKSTTTSCLVQRTGTLRDLSGVVPGQLYFVGTSGKASNNPGLPAVGRRTWQHVGRGWTSSEILLEIGEPRTVKP